MQNTALFLIVLTNIVLVLILGVLSFLIYRLFKQNLTPKTEETFHPEVLKRMKEVSRFQPKRTELFCPHHPDEPGETPCAICDRLFCSSCVKPFKSMHLCKEHLPLLMRHEWEEVLTLKTSTTDPEQGVRLYELKKEIFENEEVPTYIETHYKINVDQDHIETYLVLYAIKENVSFLKERMTEILEKGLN